MKKTLAIILAILMIVTSVPFAFAAEGNTKYLYLKISDVNLSNAMTPELYVRDDAGNEIKYDGKTQWVFISEYNEVSITEPTAEELREVNPLAMIEHYMATNRISQGEKGVINFYPHTPKESEYFRVELYLSKYNLPTRLIVYQTNGNKVAIYLDELKKVSVDNSYFIFDVAKYPNVDVNDSVIVCSKF